MFLGLQSYVKAVKRPGYIITLNSDTLYGQVKVYHFNLSTSGATLIGIDLELYNRGVRFRSDDERGFHSYGSDEIIGFGFNYHSIGYKFQRFELISNSIFKDDNVRYRFLNLIQDGRIFIYRDIIRIQSHQSNNYNNSQTYYDYYLYDNIVGLKKVEITKEIKSVRDLLDLYNVEKSFLESLSVETRFKDIRKVLKDYDNW